MNGFGWRRTLIAVWLSQFLAMASFSSAYTFMPFYFKELGVPDAKLSFYVALFNVAGNFTFCIFAPVWGMVSDVYGRRLMLLRANFGAALLLPVMALISSPEWLIVHRLALGAMAGTVSASQTLIISVTPPENRSFALGAIASALFGGMMAGQFIGGDMVMTFGFRTTFFISGALLFAAGMLVFCAKENFRQYQTLSQRLKQTSWRIPRFGKVWYLMGLFLFMSMAREFDNPFLPQLVDTVMDEAPEAVGWSGRISGFCSLAGILSGLLLGALADRMALLRIIAVAAVVAGVLRMMQCFSADVFTLLWERSLMVLAAGGLEPLMQSWLAGVTPEREHGSFFGWAACFKAIGWMTGALTGGLLAGVLNGVRGVFFGSGLMFIALAPLAVWVCRKIPPSACKQRRAQ